MSFKTLRIVSLALAIGLCTSHMGLSPNTAVVGSRQVLSFRIAHDCGDDTVGTSNFTVVMPTNPPVLGLKVEQTAIWRSVIEKMPLVPTVKVGKYEYDEAVRSVTWLGFLPDGFYRTFNVRAMMPDAVNQTLYFKGYQDCHNQGTSLKRDMIPTAENPKPLWPARGLTITALEEKAGH